MDQPLDNPIWHALTEGPHAAFAIGQGRARHYPRDMAPFSAVAEPSEAAYADLAADLSARTEARLFRPSGEERAPPGWETLSVRPILQMVADAPPAPSEIAGRAEFDLVALAPADADDMLALAEAAKPGPFDRRTMRLGDYVGARCKGRLVGMAGERFRLAAAGFVELSAICTRPEWRGRGIGAALVRCLTERAFARGETPFLHVFPDNANAVALYEKLGFRTRARLFVVWRRPLVEPR